MLGLFTTSVLGFGSTPAPTTVTGYIADYACWNSGFAMDTGASMTMLADGLSALSSHLQLAALCST